MKKLLALAVLSLSSLAFASSWESDGAHSSANFAVKHMMLSTVNGSLGDVKATLTLDDKDVTKSSVEATIDVKGLTTKNQKRDDHLRSKDFLEADKYPAITFKSTKVEKISDTKLKVTGDLKIKETTKPVTLDVELTGEIANPFTKALTRAATATTTINRKDFGLTWNVALEKGGILVGDDVKISIETEFVKKDGAAAPKK